MQKKIDTSGCADPTSLALAVLVLCTSVIIYSRESYESTSHRASKNDAKPNAIFLTLQVRSNSVNSELRFLASTELS